MKHGNSPWEPTNRAAKLKMADDWFKSFSGKPNGAAITNKERWRVPDEMSAQLNLLINTITGMQARPTSEHTANSKKELSVKYEELTKLMREIKRMCFMTPPCTDGDYITLGLPVPDHEPTAVNVPTATPDVETASGGRLQVKFIVKPKGGSEVDHRADYGIKLKGCIVPRGEVLGQISPCGVPYATEEPKHILDFKWDMFTRKSRFTLAFDNDDLAGLFYFSACYENSKGENGPWGPITMAVIA